MDGSYDLENRANKTRDGGVLVLYYIYKQFWRITRSREGSYILYFFHQRGLFFGEEFSFISVTGVATIANASRYTPFRSYTT